MADALDDPAKARELLRVPKLPKRWLKVARGR
jgi:hypothetical protein